MREHYTLARLYVPQKLSADASIDLPQNQAHFLGTVMRKNSGDPLRVFNGTDGEWLAEIKSVSKRKAVVVISKQLRSPYSPPDMWLLFAPVKKARSSFIVEKATELGASRLQPVITARTTSTVKMGKMTVQTTEAAEQTERLDLPKICQAVKLEQILHDWDARRTLIFADEAGDALPAAQALADVKAPCAVLIGPEGGFTPEERDMLRAKPYVVPVTLGLRILRSDTAALSVLTLWQALRGDWHT